MAGVEVRVDTNEKFDYEIDMRRSKKNGIAVREG